MFSKILVTYSVVLIIILYVTAWAMLSYFDLYKKKKKLDYPILPVEGAEYINNFIFKHKGSLATILKTPYISWKIVFEKHSDKLLNSSAKRVRLLMLSFLLISLTQLVTFIILFKYF